MIYIRKAIVNFFLFYAIFTFAGFSSQLEVYFFSVGQANFSILKTSTHALVVDCGTKRISEKTKDHPVNIHTEMKNSVRDILGEIKPTILISHMDDDHYCGLNDFFPKKKRSKVIVGGIPPNIRQIPADLRDDDVFFVENKQAGKVVNGQLVQLGTSLTVLINGVFGGTIDKPTVQCLLPAVNDSVDRNDQSIVVKIIYGGKSALLTGDASDALLESIATANLDCFKNIDATLFSHHGSNEHVELGLLRKTTNDIGRPILGIISSKARGASYIPKYFPDYRDGRHLGETFLQKIQGLSSLFPIVAAVPLNRFCAYHTLSMYDKSIEDIYVAPAISEDGRNIIPVFCTGDLEPRNLFYKVTIYQDGTKLTMTNQAGRILYQTVSGFGNALDGTISSPIRLAEAVVSELSEAVRTVLQEKVRIALTLVPSVTSINRDIKLLVPTDQSIGQEITSLTTIMQSGYLSKITILDRLLKLMKSVISNITFSNPTETLNFRINATGLLTTPFKTEWADFLWGNSFFVSGDLINSLSSLLFALIHIDHSDITLERITKTFQEFKSNYITWQTWKSQGRMPPKQGVPISTSLGITNSDFIKWIQEKICLDARLTHPTLFK